MLYTQITATAVAIKQPKVSLYKVCVSSIEISPVSYVRQGMQHRPVHTKPCSRKTFGAHEPSQISDPSPERKALCESAAHQGLCQSA